MIIAFCGHAKYIGNSEDEKKILEILESKVGNNTCEFFLGEYGGFDRFAYECAKKFKANHPKAKIIFITPYRSPEYLTNHTVYDQDRFDLIIYPNLENIPARYALSHRNKWIAEKADILISYIDHEYGGAYKMYRHAKQKGKEIYNLAQKGKSQA